MSREVLVILPHSRGRAEASRLVANAIEQGKSSLGHGIVNADVQWPRDDHGTVSVRALGQTVLTEIDVEDTQVRVRVRLPWLLSGFAGQIAQRIEQAGAGLQIAHDPKTGANPKT